MLSFLCSQKQQTRRSFIQAGALGLTGFSLANLLRAEAQAGIGSSNKAIINVHLDGGPPHMDMIDLKPDAPVEIRGEFQPISSKVSGIHICELLPRMAAQADQFALIRSLVGSAGAHNAFQCQSGFRKKDMLSVGGRPALGSVIAKLESTAHDLAPPFVDIMQGRGLVRNSARPGFLGPSYQPFRPDLSDLFERQLEKGMQGELKRLGADHQVSLKLNPALSLQRLENRTTLLSKLDTIRRKVDSSGMMDAMDRFSQQAVSILTSGRLADAMDLSKEDPATLARYSPASQNNASKFTTSDGPDAVKKFLIARRLVEAGVRCVSISISDFDTHRNNFERLRQLLPIVDHGLSALVTDLQERGMLDDVTIVAWGEFGRTPRINSKNGGRDHWPRVGPAIIAGGGLKTGQVIGKTDRTASSVVQRPVHYKDVFATLYHTLGIDPHAVTLTDPRGRPQYLLDEGKPLVELI
ncbi:MAG: DUF1501 domain-containing protein [Planctomycetes bacterium]|nr:DUF1501 domain-containing protein [Planctomycetota bacterium]MCH9778732.1 DUF1501 domain-containing protein [Planctomycetota bacterium]MCH9790014.1 DUF1501 domain-containing protein [Planctomycetota bacterium]MDF1743469.1 DUF1501 domain-containing protein [Gimesia sp.]